MSVSQASFRILCIEDEPEILSDLVEELRDYGFQVDAAADAEAGLAQVRKELPDLIVCDMQLPGMSGLELLHLLRDGEGPASSVPFVFLTAFGDRAAMIEGRKAGADDYLVKPIDYDLLIAAVESHLTNAARRAELAASPPRFPGDEAGERDSHRLLGALAQRGAGVPLAIAKIDNMAEGLRRFAARPPHEVAELTRRLAAIAGIEAYWINAHTLAFTGTDEARLEQVLRRLLDLRLRDRHAATPVPIGFSIVTGRTRPDEDATLLLDRLIEAARLVQREGGRRKVALDGPELQGLRLAGAIRAELVDAIGQGQMHVCLQPMVRVSDGLPICAEVLVRWESPTLGALSPELFIPVIERAGLLVHVTNWVIDQAAQCQIELLRRGLPPRLSVNVGAAEFTDDLPARLATIFARHGADPGLLEVEITETSLIADPTVARRVASELHALGVSLALDDFGTGFSSLSNIQSCAVDAIKIDRSFVDRLEQSETNRRIVAGVMQLAATLGLETIAEGVELIEQQRWLADQGCAVMQGYLFARPMRFADYCRVVEEWCRRGSAAA